jgi:hypothetical protein
MIFKNAIALELFGKQFSFCSAKARKAIVELITQAVDRGFVYQ